MYLYTTGTIFFKYVFLFCATLTYRVKMSLFLGATFFFFVATTYFFVTYIILVRNVNFYVKYFFFVDTRVFCATQHILCYLM